MERDLFTAALHADDDIAEYPDIAPPIRPSTTFEYSANGRVYKRLSDGTTERLEAVLGVLEGGHAVAYPSGMAAAAAVLRHLRPRRIALPDDVYHGVGVFVNTEAARGSWEVVAPDELGEGDVWWVETPSNPKCLITDLAATSAAAEARGAVTVVDATFATPILQETLSFGVDFSVHATTKFIAGHSDAMGGVASTGNAAVAEELRAARINDGAIPGSLEAWLTLRGLRTLPLRVARQSETAHQVAEFLTGRVPTVWYPGLESHPGHDVAARQMAAFGGVVSFEIEDADSAPAVVDRLRVFANATSLGGVESLAEYRRRSDAAAPPGLIRLSVGLESAAALIDDLDQALAQ
jgi:cystathionine gamma-synthase